MEGFSPVALLPAYQAEETVGEVARGARRFVDRVLVVDDGSTDRTAERAAGAGAEVLRLPENSGKGSAVRAGLERILASDATHVVFLDADGQHDPDDLPALLGAARQGDSFVIGSRVARPEETPAVRYRTNEIGRRILTRMTRHAVEEGETGYPVLAAQILRLVNVNGP